MILVTIAVGAGLLLALAAAAGLTGAVLQAVDRARRGAGGTLAR